MGRKILCVSDLHFHDYAQRNPSEKYRLLQSRTVCENIVGVGKQECVSDLFIAGDILEKYLIRPYIQAEIKNCLEYLSKNFERIFFIYGNHDMDNKGNESCFTDSCLSVMLPANMYYVDKQVIEIEGVKFGFSNWRPEFDLSWINGKVDFLITHATICYSDDEIFQSQVLDESKFDLAICGDIHRAAKKGKFVSIGVPQKCKMSDSNDSSGVVIDCGDKSYKWVNLNPLNNLMKFEYTEVREEEGWDSNTGIWKVYKPVNQSISGGLRDIQVPAWEEIGKLTEDIIIANNLQAVHGEVLQNIKDIESKEVDFNFVITRFYCKNWRSIDEAELFFSDHDKILITGANGSGKSSLLSAIKYALVENPRMKDLIMFGEKECLTEIEFLYQGNSCKIQRGSKTYGFWINGEKQKYNGKRDFEKDMHIRFPFIDYLDVCFFDSDHPRLIGDFLKNPERKSEIISRFYKLDKIDAYNEQAITLFNKYLESYKYWEAKLGETSKLLEHVESKLGLIRLPQMTVEELGNKKQAGLIIQQKWVAYNQYKTLTADLQALKKTKEARIESLALEIGSFRDRATINNEIAQYQGTISWINAKNKELSDIKVEGRRLYQEYQGIGKNKTCPSCGQTIKSDEHLEQHKKELEGKIQVLLGQQDKTYNDFMNYGIQSKAEIDGGCQSVIRESNQRIATLMSEVNNQNNIIREKTNTEQELSNIIQRISNVGPEPEKIELPNGFMEQMGQIEVDLSIWNNYNSLLGDRNNCLTEMNNYKGELDKMTMAIDAYKSYIKLTGTTGVIYKEIMTRLASQFSDNQVVYKVDQTIGTGNRKDHLDLESYYVLGDNEVRYINCSDGQKTFLDIDFLSKVVPRMGLLVMDEFLKHLDAKNHDVVLDMIGQMNVGLILISSHMESIPAFNNKSITLGLNESGVTKIDMK
jgi:energy-coupling factor transporter ATP-binding protein EcfA2